MPHLVELSNGEYLSLFCFSDALDAVEDLGGRGLRDFIEEYMQDNMDDAAYERMEAENARKVQKRSEEHYRDEMLVIRDGLDKILERVNPSQRGGNDMRNLVNTLLQTVDSMIGEMEESK